jgi:hypothetical protein
MQPSHMIALVALVLAPAATAAHASCADEIKTETALVKPKTVLGDPPQYNKEMKKARELVKSDELGCLNAMVRARRARTKPLQNQAPAAALGQPTQPLHPATQPLNQATQPLHAQ